MKSIKTGHCDIHFNANCYVELNDFIAKSNFSKLFILVDSNTHENCLPKLMSNLETNFEIEIIEIENGEEYKTIDTCLGVWNALSELDADRKSLMINLGGGVVTDLGAFVASTFKRGIQYINVPTTLLSMVDASVGGKTGVDLGALKNQIGVINNGAMVLIDTTYLDTLPNNELRSGYAEMLKHGLISSEDYWNRLRDLSNLTLANLDKLIYESVIIKNNIVTEDPRENGLRKTLNYGHTLGHAIESLFLEDSTKTTLLHGEAIAIGMVLATYISNKLLGFPEQKMKDVKSTMIDLYSKVDFTNKDYQEIISLLKFDKKNSHGNINFVLLNDIASPKIDCIVENKLILEAFDYYKA
ncbi:MAG: 3-dehydroquinate synthase [Flavobacteriaceae bacterium]